jgi:hypothetical protein
MARRELPKCLFCGKLFRADPRNARHQKYCSEPSCRKASQAASRRAWLAKPENLNYFRGPENVARVQWWRADHPGYWRRPGGQRAQKVAALQDLCRAQRIEIKKESPPLAGPPLKDALQDLLSFQPAVLIGFIAQFTGSALQDDIVRSTRQLIELGQDILAGRVGDAHQTGTLPGASA